MSQGHQLYFGDDAKFDNSLDALAREGRATQVPHGGLL